MVLDNILLKPGRVAFCLRRKSFPGDRVFSRLFQAELLADQNAKAVLNFGVARNWRFAPVLGVEVKIMAFTTPAQIASCVGKFLDERPAFHTSTVSSFVKISPGVGGFSSSMTSW